MSHLFITVLHYLYGEGRTTPTTIVYFLNLYNHQDNGYYYGIYCGNNQEKAEQKYLEKIAYYRGEVERKPSNLLEALNAVRLSGVCNMLDITGVIEVLENYHYHEVASYIQKHKDNYSDFLEELTEYLRENQPQSLAQQLAQVTGWEVIVD